MPKISPVSYLRIVYADHQHPPPHFHAIYGEYEVEIAIETLEIMEGRMPRRALGLVVDWAELHSQDLRDNWTKSEEHWPLRPIQPLEY